MSGEGIPIREIDPDSEAEVRLVAERMRQTLVEVLGEEKGAALYTMEWLEARVRWHLDPGATTAKVLLATGGDGRIIGHAIARVEREEDGRRYGYFSTVFVERESRRRGVATSFMARVEEWFAELAMPRIVYNTAKTNTKLISLFQRHGYRITHAEAEMVQLTKPLPDGE